jgi:hypothetical protein
MNKKAIILAIITLTSLFVMPIYAGPTEKGNGLPKHVKTYNLNIIGHPNDLNANFDGGSGHRIFVKRTGTTSFYVHGEPNTFAILDRDGTDGKVGQDRLNPGIILPYDNDEWKVEIYIRLVGPMSSTLNWKSYYWDGIDTYVKFAEFTLDRTDKKFSLKTGQLLLDGYQDILWELTGNKFRIAQMRIIMTSQ